MNRRKLIAGNWKMHGNVAALGEIDAIAASMPPGVDVALFPPFTLLDRAAGRGVAIGGQDCHAEAHGPYTGCVSAAMLAEAGATFCIVGHSERRAAQGETDAAIRGKAGAAIAAGLTAIICVGETLAQRDSGEAETVVRAQLAGSLPPGRGACVIAYEPVWAIGTGRVASCSDIMAMHGAIRTVVGDGVRILYGGSVKPSNATEILRTPDVDGALVGGASLTSADFVPIILAAVDKDRPSE